MIRCTALRSPLDPALGAEEYVVAHPATLRACRPSWMEGVDAFATRNGRRVAREDWDQGLEDGDLVAFVPVLGGPFAALPAFVGMSAGIGPGSVPLFETGLTLFGKTLATGGAGLKALAFAGNLLFTGLLSTVVGNLLKGKPAQPGEQDSPTYGFRGIQANPNVAGAAMPIIYGETRVAGPVINIYTEALPEQDTFVNMLILLAGHQVYDIGGKLEDGGPFTSEALDLPAGLQINGQPAENYHGITCHVRMGTTEQEAVPGFAQARLQYPVEATLEGSDIPSTVEAVPGVYLSSDPEITKWDTEVSFTMNGDADEFTAIIEFDAGLFGISTSSGKYTLQTVRLQARYRLAPGGTPTGSYVVLPPFGDVVAKKSNPFSVSFSRTFIDPADFVPPVSGYYLNLPGGSARAASANTTLVPDTGAENVAFSVVAWLKPVTGTSGGGGGTLITFEDDYFIFVHAGGNKGLRVYFEKNGATHGTGIGTQIEGMDFAVDLGDGSAMTTYAFSDSATPIALTNPGAEAKGFTMLAITYEADVNETGSGQLRFYLNDQLKKTTLIPVEDSPLHAVSQPIIVGASTTAGADSCLGGIDETLFFDRALGSVEVAILYAGGAPQQTAADATGIVAGWHFDVDGSDFVGARDLTLSGATITGGTDFGPVAAASQGTPLKGRYLVEIQRINADNTDDVVQDTATWGSIIETSHDEFRYPGSALLAVKIQATDQLSGGQPLITALVKGALCPVISGLGTATPAPVFQWTSNPAWVLAHAATDKRLGLGRTYEITDLAEELEEFSIFCDEPVYDGLGREQIQFAQVDDADTMAIVDPLFENGRLIVHVDGEDWPETWPVPFSPSVSAADATFFFGIDGTDGTSAPSWLTDLEDVFLAVGQIVLLTGNVYEVWLHLAAPAIVAAVYSRVQRVLVDFGSGASAGQDQAVAAIDSCIIGRTFSRITNMRMSDSGRTTPGGAALLNPDVGMTTLIQSPTLVAFGRYASGVNEDHQVAAEALEYIGPIGGANEWVKVLSVQVTIPDGTTDFTYSPAISAIIDWTRCVVDVSGRRNDRALGAADSVTVGGAVQADKTLRLRRGNGTGECICSVAVREMVGSNWTVHVVSHVMATVGAVEQAVISVPIVSWDKAFIVHSHRIPSGELANEDSGLVALPGSDTGHIAFFLNAGADNVASGDYLVVAYIVENPDIDVIHDNAGLGGTLATFASGDTSVDYTVPAVDMETTVVYASGACAGAASSLPLPCLQYRLTTPTNVNVRRGATGAACFFALQLVSMPAVVSGGVFGTLTFTPGTGEDILLGGGEHRMSFDGVFDRTDFPGWEALRVITKSARGEPMKMGSRLSLFWDAPRSLSNIMSMGNIVGGSFRTTYSGLADRPNVVEAEFNDRDLNFEPQQIVQEHDEVTDPTLISSRRVKAIRMEGVVRRSQVMRHLTWMLNRFFLSRRMVEIQGGPDAVAILPGRRVGVSHDVPQWGFSGRVRQSSISLASIYLDRPVTLLSGTTYFIELRFSASGTIEQREVDSGAGTFNPGSPIPLTEPFSGLPLVGDVYRFGNDFKDFLVLRTVLDPGSMTRSIRGIEWDDQVYLDDFGDLPDTPVSDLPPPNAGDIPPPVDDLSVDEETILQKDGATSLGLLVSWRQPKRPPEGYAVWVVEGTGTLLGAREVALLPGHATSHRIASEELRHLVAYTVAVQPIAPGGARQPLRGVSRGAAFMRGLTRALPAPTGLSANLPGDLAEVSWEPLPAARTIEVRSGGWILGEPVASAGGGAGFAETGRWSGGPSNAFGLATQMLVARGVSGMGQYGAAAVARVSPAHALYTDDLFESAEEDGWAGTLTALVASSTPVAGEGTPLEDRSPYLHFSGGALEGSYEVLTDALPRARRVYLQAAYIAAQVHPITWEEMTWTWGSIEMERWSWEGPTSEDPEDLFGNASAVLEVITSTTSTVPSTGWRKFQAGIYTLCRARFRLQVVRDDPSYDVRIKRLALRVTLASEAIDSITDVAAATDEHVLTKDTATGDAIFKAAAVGSSGLTHPQVMARTQDGGAF